MTQPKLLTELRATLPLKVGRAKRGVGSFLTLDLADDVSEDACHVWVYLCDWVISERGVPALTSSDPAREADPLPFLLGKMLRTIDLDLQVPAIVFLFDEEFRLRLTPNLGAYKPFDNLVMFFRPQRRVLAFSYQLGFYETD